MKKSTAKADNDVLGFISGLDDETRQKDADALIDIMHKASGKTAKMGYSSIITFGKYHYRYESGTEGETCILGFSPRKDKFALYLTGTFDKSGPLWQKLGKYKTAKGCTYIKRMTDVDSEVLFEIIKDAWQNYKARLEAAGVKVTEAED